jgi:uncharacterized protein (DUF1499 family)
VREKFRDTLRLVVHDRLSKRGATPYREFRDGAAMDGGVTDAALQSPPRWRTRTRSRESQKRQGIIMFARTLVAIVVVLLAAGGWLAYRSQTASPPDTRLIDGRLRPCPGTPNCVSSESPDSNAQIAPVRFEGAPEAAWEKLRKAVTESGGRIVEERDGYLHATFTSRVFRFVDDLEIRMDAAQSVIHIRSGSRVGKSDFGVNRERVEAVRAKFDAGAR